MQTIEIDVKNKIATALNEEIILLSDNRDYIVKFNFDEEWDDYEVKTARFTFGRAHEDVVFKGDMVLLPKIRKATSIGIGVYSGNLKVTTPAVILCRKSVISDAGLPPPPPPDVYVQIMELLNSGGGVNLTFDDTPTEGSQNPVTSDGIYKYIQAVKQNTVSTDEVVYLDGGRISNG